MLADYRQRIKNLLTAILPDSPDPLHQAMRYSVLGGGKRIRPLLVYAMGLCVGAPIALLDHAAVACELLHCYSLIHDDLPAMDNADERHHQPSCHRKFNEALAILAGDALQSLAFTVIARNRDNQQVALLARAASDMVLGQSLDLQGNPINLAALHELYRYKTGALITVSVELGNCCAATNDMTTAIALGNLLGIAFQIQDDLLDITANHQTLGKPSQQDQKLGKMTYPDFVGFEIAKQHLAHYFVQIDQLLVTFSNHDLFRQLIAEIRERNY